MNKYIVGFIATIIATFIFQVAVAGAEFKQSLVTLNISLADILIVALLLVNIVLLIVIAIKKDKTKSTFF